MAKIGHFSIKTSVEAFFRRPVISIPLPTSKLVNQLARGRRASSDSEEVTRKGSLKSAVKLFKFMKPYLGYLIAGSLFLLLSTATSLIFPKLMGDLFDASDLSREEQFELLNTENILSVALMLMLVFFGQAIFSFLRILCYTLLTEGFLKDIRQAAYTHLIKLPLTFYNKRRVGELSSRIQADISTIQESLMTSVAEFVRGVLTIVVGLILVSVISIELTLYVLACVPPIVVIAVLFGRFIKKLSKRTQEAIADSNVILEETFTGITNVKAFSNEGFETERYNSKTSLAKAIAVKGGIWRGGFISMMIMLFSGVLVFFVWQAVEMKEAGDIELSTFVSFVLYAILIGASFGGIPTTYSQIQKALGATEELMEVFDEEPEDLDRHGNVALTGEVAFDQVKFHYESRPDIEVLSDVSFVAKPGQHIAIVGPSGSGKTTITALIYRFYNPIEGAIKFDGKNASEYDLVNIREQMAIVPQEVILFGGTIRDNILYGNPEADEEMVMEAARKANALEFIESFPDGLETVVGERGIQLSGGQRQRIAIARAILKDPVILILDEATSALDSESEHLVQEALDRLMEGRTTFVVAHRLSTIRNADRIIVLQKGVVVENGSHDELMTKENGVFRKMNEYQLEFN